MRGQEENQGFMFTYLSSEQRVPEDHPLRMMKAFADAVLKEMNPTFKVMDKNPGLFDKLIDEVSNVLFTKGLDKNLEFEADRYGREFAYRMGYYPGVLQNFIRKLGKSKEGGNSIFMSIHPSTGERYNRLKKTWNRYRKASLYPVLGKRFFSVLKRPDKS